RCTDHLDKTPIRSEQAGPRYAFYSALAANASFPTRTESGFTPLMFLVLEPLPQPFSVLLMRNATNQPCQPNSDRAPGDGVGARGRSRSPAGLAGCVRRPLQAA